MTDENKAKVIASVEGDVGVITLNDPGTLNAIGLDVMAELTEAFDDFAYGNRVRSILFTGTGRAFCSGANLSGGRATSGAGPADSLLRTINPWMAATRRSPKPIVSAVNGAAAGVGVSLALMGDIVVAAQSAYFLLAFRRVGLVPDGGATWMLPRLIGKARAMELMLLGERLPAATALDWGLINRCVPDAELMPTAMALAQTLAEGPASLGATRNLVWDSLDAAWSEQLEAEAFSQGWASRTEDALEGVAAFTEKRPAKFVGR